MHAGGTGRIDGVPREIAGFPTRVENVRVGGSAIPLVVVADLETRLDRRRLLVDETYVPPYWALLWSGAHLLADHVMSEINCRGRAVLDVGCGLGLTSLAAARVGGRVTAIDRDPVPLEFLRASAELNRVRVELVPGDVGRLRLRWRYDLVLCAELLYEAEGFEALVSALGELVAPRGRVLLADARRMDTSPFWQAAAAAGFAETEIAAVEVLEETTRVRIRLVELTRPC